jgi:O-succinylbenzoic acid--CoA ligase
VLLAVCLPPSEAAPAIRAAWDAGRAVAPLDPSAPPPELERALAALRPTHLLDEAGERPWAGGGEPVAPEAAAVVTTTGTTGIPRPVELTWSGLHASAAAVAAALGVRADDRWVCCLPLHHVGGLAVIARAWETGIPATVADAATADGSFVSLVPTQLQRLLDAGVDMSRFRRILVGGTAVPRRLRSLPNVVTTYGLTETWGGVVHDGRPLPGVEVRLAPVDREIQVRTPTVMRGYRLDPVATAAAFTSDGWLRTGDVGAWSPDGRLTVVDRIRDMIVTGGVNVSPTEVETVLARHPAVRDVCVVGRPDEEWGERVVAYVVAADPSAPPPLEDLRSFARHHLSPPKLPRQVVPVAAIPRTAGGKPMRRRLLESASAR